MKETTHGTEVRKQGNKPYFRKFEGLLQRSQHANRVLADWIGFYNHQRPHQSLGMKSPIEVREALAV
ncbi:integrase core domain-containing protein [Oligella sp. MSHR50489EDL]|uniref:integrase core domain-containing protein n=1 Tax=Oligella sp. MSHR50489EDL TaxID=3139409 RepID=UPI003D815042